MENGNLIHTKSGKCAKPKGAITDGVVLGLYSSCDGHQFSFTAGGSLQHVGSKKCVNSKTGVSVNEKWCFEVICLSKQKFIYSLFTTMCPLRMIYPSSCVNPHRVDIILILFSGQSSI